MLDTSMTIGLHEVDSSYPAQSSCLRERFENGSMCQVTRQYIAKEHEKEVAYVALDHHEEYGVFVVYEIYVDPLSRRRGIARQILRESELMARKLGYKKIRLKPKPLDNSISEDALVRFYESEGFRWMCGAKDQMEKKLSPLNNDGGV